ncbi:hypothetical protein GPALN_011906 [Globodera pallida]|nr:hypothetical protein GPALN_011906 [Globodera pallida]
MFCCSTRVRHDPWRHLGAHSSVQCSFAALSRRRRSKEELKNTKNPFGKKLEHMEAAYKDGASSIRTSTVVDRVGGELSLHHLDVVLLTNLKLRPARLPPCPDRSDTLWLSAPSGGIQLTNAGELLSGSAFYLAQQDINGRCDGVMERENR